jgi:hypothetical protein
MSSVTTSTHFERKSYVVKVRIPSVSVFLSVSSPPLAPDPLFEEHPSVRSPLLPTSCCSFFYILCFACTVHGLGPPTCSDSELTCETVNPFRHFGRSPWTKEPG